MNLIVLIKFYKYLHFIGYYFFTFFFLLLGVLFFWEHDKSEVLDLLKYRVANCTTHFLFGYKTI